MAALSVPGAVINGVSVYIKPNSLKYTEGFGERKVRVASGGGARKEIIATEDVETQFSDFMITVYTTTENIALHREWLANFNANTVGWIEKGESRTINNAIVTSNAEINPGVEGEFEVAFQGDAAV